MAIFFRKEVDGFTQYEISRGSHYCKGWRIRSCGSRLKFIFKFSDSCMYNPASVIPGYNKLTGIVQLSIASPGVHENSIRIGWISKGNTLQLALYCYVEGERTVIDICTTQPDTENTGEISIGGGVYTVTINGQTATCPQAYTGGAKFKLFPYFGGQSTATATMDIYIKEI